MSISKEILLQLTKEELVSKLVALQIYVEELENTKMVKPSQISLTSASNSNSHSTTTMNDSSNDKNNQTTKTTAASTSKLQKNAADSSSSLNLNLVDGISSSAFVGSSGQEERFRQQQLEASRRENVLVMRLTTKEQEVQDYLAQLEELRASVGSGVRNMLLDPAVNALFQRMKHELQQTKEKLDQSAEELNAWKFTPDSNSGKRLMARCRTLIQENTELGNLTSTGRIAKLEGDLSVAKKVCEELKNSQADIDGFLLELDEDMEGMQTTVMSLQREVKELRDENRLLKLCTDEPCLKPA